MNKSEAEVWLHQHRVYHFDIVDCAKYGFVVNTHNSVYLSDIDSIPVKFGHIKGGFDCADNNLTSLYGAPERVDGQFNCSGNQLTTLQYCPKFAVAIMCDRNQLISLQYAPEVLEGFFSCEENMLKSLEHCPRVVGGAFYAGYNQLETLLYLPDEVGCDIFLYNNPKLGDCQQIDKLKQLKVISQIHREAHILSSIKSELTQKIIKI